MDHAPTKQRNAPLTKARILAAAQAAFATSGYSQTGIRDIAEAAGVSSTILLRYFGSKAGLFEAALLEVLTPEGLLPKERSQFGRRVASLVLERHNSVNPHAMVALSTGDPDAREIAIRVLREHALEPIAAWLGPPNAEGRALQVLALCTSFELYAHQIELIPGGAGASATMTEWLISSLQAIADHSAD